MATILIVDDEHGTAESLAWLLEAEGIDTHCAFDGKTGLKSAQDNQSDLVVLDVMLTALDGLTMGKILRAMPSGKHIKIVMFSCLPESTVKEAFDGYDAFIRKPADADTVLQRIRSLLCS